METEGKTPHKRKDSNKQMNYQLFGVGRAGGLMTQADWASITCRGQQTTFATEAQALTHSGGSQADLEFLVDVVLFGR